MINIYNKPSTCGAEYVAFAGSWINDNGSQLEADLRIIMYRRARAHEIDLIQIHLYYQSGLMRGLTPMYLVFGQISRAQSKNMWTIEL